eukprot:12268043-Prorocentrum_lima.AAC.1
MAPLQVENVRNQRWDCRAWGKKSPPTERSKENKLSIWYDITMISSVRQVAGNGSRKGMQ